MVKGSGISELTRVKGDDGKLLPTRGSVLLDSAEVERETGSLFQALKAASEPPQMVPKMIGGHLAVTINSECLRPSCVVAPHTVQSHRNKNQQVVSLALTWARELSLGGKVFSCSRVLQP